MGVNVYDIITDRIIAELKKGVIPWHKPWIVPAVTLKTEKIAIDPTKAAYSRSTGKAYSLLNQMLLGKAGEWATYQQITEAGGHVRKGEKSAIAVFWKFLPVETGRFKEDGTAETKEIPYLRYYNVFHTETQCDGIAPRKRGAFETITTGEIKEGEGFTWDADDKAEQISRDYLQRSGVGYREEPGGARAYYSPTTDSITTPGRAQFKRPEEFYSTLFHEMTHSTGHKSRLCRFAAADQFHFGSESYSKEELVAELGAAALNNLVGIESGHSFRNSAAYVQSWIKALQNDHRLIVNASGKAEQAVAFILGAE